MFFGVFHISRGFLSCRVWGFASYLSDCLHYFKLCFIHFMFLIPNQSSVCKKSQLPFVMSVFTPMLHYATMQLVLDPSGTSTRTVSVDSGHESESGCGCHALWGKHVYQ